MTKKPSFFDKLSSSINNDSEELTIKDADPSTLKELAREEKKDWLPASEGQLTVDVYQTPNEIIIKSTIAGVKQDDLDISISNDMITIKGKREKDEEIRLEDYYYRECYWGNFSRSIVLPVDIEPDKVEAQLKNGILTVILPKIEKTKTKKVKVKVD